MRSLEARPMAHRIRKGDLVQVITGADRGKQGRVVAVDRTRGRLRVEKVRMQKRHLKAGRKAARTGGVIEQEGFIDASNVMLVDPGSNRTSRVRFRREGDQKVRTFARSGDDVPEPAAT
jgi:large subunit ribosomal protein L24